MRVDGKAIAEEIRVELARELAVRKEKPVLVVIQAGADPASVSFVRIKRRFAQMIGVSFEVVECAETVSTAQLIDAVKSAGERHEVLGVVVQLPLPAHIATEEVLAAIPKEKDVDALRHDSPFLAPVAGAVAEIILRYRIEIQARRVMVIGQGRLVGKPVAAWFRAHGARVQVVDEHTQRPALAALTREADIIVTGAGVPWLITPNMIKDGVVLIDAGTSEHAGKLTGDVDPACEPKCKLFTPVPGGIGPITVAALFRNLVRKSTER